MLKCLIYQATIVELSSNVYSWLILTMHPWSTTLTSILFKAKCPSSCCALVRLSQVLKSQYWYIYQLFKNLLYHITLKYFWLITHTRAGGPTDNSGEVIRSYIIINLKASRLYSMLTRRTSSSVGYAYVGVYYHTPYAYIPRCVIE